MRITNTHRSKNPSISRQQNPTQSPAIAVERLTSENGEPSKPKRKKKKRKNNDTDDDTPKEFKRLMLYKTTGKRPNGLDDPGAKRGQKRKLDEIQASNTKTKTDTKQPKETSTSKELPLLPLPGEKLSDFNRRVDQSIPVTFKGNTEEASSKHKKKKRIHNIQQDPTEDDYDIDDEGNPLSHPKNSIHNRVSGGNNANKRRKVASRNSPDPFEELKKKRPIGQEISINDVVQAPPTLIKVREKLHTRGLVGTGETGSIKLDVPKSSGSLARREVLQEERLGVLEKYRALMDRKAGRQIS